MPSRPDDPPATDGADGGSATPESGAETDSGAVESDATTDAETESRLPVSRRALLAGAAVTGVVGAGAVALGGGGDGGGDDDADGATGDGSAAESTATRRTTPVADDEARRLAERFAPTLYFGRRERWFPTDPRPFVSERDGERVVDGFDALDGYTAAKGETMAPDPTVFYHVREYSERLAVVQYWLYSAFDQFSVNFHWHDWELLQAFVDRDSGDPVLYAASAHSRTVPNNEYLDPESTPAIISEVGSHSSALGMNERRDTFQRLPVDGLAPDVTNGVVAVVSGEEGVPLAYGLPRDEGFRLPYVVPELDGAPLTDHPDLPNVSAEDLVPADLTVESFADRSTPPTDLPERERGAVFEPESRAGDENESEGVNEHYALVPTVDIEDITAFTGPQLSFQFSVPRFVEDAVSSHITTTSTPWTQPRYRDPLADVTDRSHRRAIRERYDVDAGDRGATIIGRIAELRPSDDVDVGVTLATPPVEAVARLASDPTAAPTFGGVAAFVDVAPGDHTLTVNGPGYAPYAQRVPVGDGSGSAETTEAAETASETVTTPSTATEAASATETPVSTGTSTETPVSTGTETGAETETDGTVRIGAGGRIGLVPRADAVKLEVDAAERGGARRVRVEDDVAGRVFDAPPVQSEGRAGVYVHRAGGYTVEVTDERGRTSVERVTPGPNQNAAEVAKARTGVSGVTRYLVEFLTETRETVERLLEPGGGDERGRESERGEDDDTDGDDGATPTPEPDTTETETADADATIELDVQPSEDEDRETDGDDATTLTSASTATATPEATGTPEATTPLESVPTLEPTTADAGQRPTGPLEELRAALEAAVSRAQRANQAALAGDDAATVEALRALREVLARLSSFAERGDAPQPAARIAARRAETADRRAVRALDTLT
ncbi:hypothetical protein C2R22_14315 [Salinigranum rubrum]|uniref:Uncharacterized protein n=1 Tax=Salinigranum rubrum TaxID=755307 RepID=A0A2I8VL75_9EURY|nr:hypothetical protein [Salinigranum rubrum]AUV82671.1 hypothetical protein C2R22_14315 [Salinigranum rubrum]